MTEIAWSDTDGILWGFVKDNVHDPLLTRSLHELKTRIREACANTDQKILHNAWQDVEYRFDIARTTRGAHIELYWKITVHKTFSISLSVGVS
jgi:hypothetical protein